MPDRQDRSVKIVVWVLVTALVLTFVASLSAVLIN
jgi:hypothetical protein